MYKFRLLLSKKNLVLKTNSGFISISLQPYVERYTFDCAVKSKSLSLEYERFTPSGCIDIEIRKFEIFGKKSVPLGYIKNKIKNVFSVHSFTIDFKIRK